jgi:hypothetical protein
MQNHILCTSRCLGTLADGLGSFPLAHEAYPSRTYSRNYTPGIRSLVGVSTLVWAILHSVSLPPGATFRGGTSIPFGENQLSRGLISLSLLLSAHPSMSQDAPVRTSIACYRDFILAKSRSPPLRVYCQRLERLIQTRFRFALGLEALGLATDNNSQTHYAKGTRSLRRASTLCRHMIAGSLSLRSQRFFSPFPRGTCSLSVTSEYLALGGGPPGFTRSFTDIALLRIHLSPSGFRLQASHLLWGDFPVASPNLPDLFWCPTTPGGKPPGLGCSAFARHY